MPLVTVVGLGWGDEGKGKVVDLLAGGASAVARFSGGANAGHTVRFQGRPVVLHQVPTGLLHDGVKGLVGPGCVADPAAMLDEIDALSRMGVPLEGRLSVSPGVHLVHPAYRLLEAAEERARGAAAIGTTGRGIGPAYTRKFARTGMRLADTFDPGRLEALSEAVIREVPGLDGDAAADLESQSGRFLEASMRLSGLCGDVPGIIRDVLGRDGTVIAEGAQGTLLDPDHGTYPFVTSGSCTASAAFTGLGIAPRATEVVGIMKAYSTRVGSGPFPSELADATGEHLRTRGNEYGATTGRPRRCGWLDLVLMRYSVLLNGVSWIALTLLDVLGGLPVIRVATSWEGAGGTDPLSCVIGLDRVRPVYETLPGWSGDIRGERAWESLPAEARRFVEFVETACGAPVRLISTGPSREDVIWRTA